MCDFSVRSTECKMCTWMQKKHTLLHWDMSEYTTRTHAASQASISSLTNLSALGHTHSPISGMTSFPSILGDAPSSSWQQLTIVTLPILTSTNTQRVFVKVKFHLFVAFKHFLTIWQMQSYIPIFTRFLSSFYACFKGNVGVCCAPSPILVKNPPAMQETAVRFLSREDPLEKGSATHSSILGLPWWLSW